MGMEMGFIMNRGDRDRSWVLELVLELGAAACQGQRGKH
jgi:hypothetical protein